MSLFCINPDCARPAQHGETCKATTDKPCKGCQPGRATDGVLLCRHHLRHLHADAFRLAELYAECEHALGGGRGEGGERPSGTQPGIELSENAARARRLIASTLRGTAAFVAIGRKMDLPWVWRVRVLPAGMHGPYNRRRESNLGHAALANFIAAHADWIAAQPKAGSVSSRMEKVARLAYGAAYPSGARIIHIGPCPVEVDDEPCPGKVRALISAADELLPSSIICDHERTHCWRSDEWRALGKRLGRELSGYMTALEISIHYRRPVGTVYRMASERQWRRTADGLRPIRYDWRDVDQTMRSVTA
jgi:hypothetical protein